MYDLFHQLLCNDVEYAACSKSNDILKQGKTSNIVAGCCTIQVITL